MGLRNIVLSAAFAFSLAACGSEPATKEANTAPVEAALPAEPTATVEISDLFVLAPREGRNVSGGGMKITATGGDFRLVSASGEDAEKVELHTMSMEDDMMKMRQVEGFDITDGETLSLEPGGPHLMVFGLDTTLQIGDETEMLFTFESSDGETVTLNYRAQIRSIEDL